MCLPLVHLRNRQHALTDKCNFSSNTETTFTVEQIVPTNNEPQHEHDDATELPVNESGEFGAESFETMIVNKDEICETESCCVTTDETFSINLLSKLLKLNDETSETKQCCTFANCDQLSLPRTHFCLFHIAACDKDQLLFNACKARHSDFSQCNEAISPIKFIYNSPLNDDCFNSNLCEEHSQKAAQAEKLRLQRTTNKMTYMDRCRAKRLRKLARDETTRAKLETKRLKRENEANANRKNVRVCATVRIWKRRKRRKQPRMIQTAGKSLTNYNILSRPYPDYEWALSNSQSSSSDVDSLDDFSESDSNTIRTFSTATNQIANQQSHMNSTSSSPNRDDEDLQKSPVSKLFEDARTEMSTIGTRPQPVRPPEPLTPELSDDSLQGLQLPGCLDSPSFFANFDQKDLEMNLLDDCFTDSLDKFMSGVFDEVLSPNHETQCLTILSEKETEKSADVSLQSGRMQNESETTNNAESKKEKSETNTNKTGEDSCVLVSNCNRESEKISDSSDHEARKTVLNYADHDYSVVHNFTVDDSSARFKDVDANSSKCDEENAEQMAVPQKISTVSQQTLVDSVSIKTATTSLKGRTIDPKDLKKDRILFQPKADAQNIVRVKFRPAIVERGLDPHFGSRDGMETSGRKSGKRKSKYKMVFAYGSVHNNA